MKGISARLRVGVRSIQDSGGLSSRSHPLVRLLLARGESQVRGGADQQVLGPLSCPLLLWEVPLLQSEGRKHREVEDRLQHQRPQQDQGDRQLGTSVSHLVVTPGLPGGGRQQSGHHVVRPRLEEGGDGGGAGHPLQVQDEEDEGEQDHWEEGLRHRATQDRISRHGREKW